MIIFCCIIDFRRSTNARMFTTGTIRRRTDRTLANLFVWRKQSATGDWMTLASVIVHSYCRCIWLVVATAIQFVFVESSGTVLLYVATVLSQIEFTCWINHKIKFTVSWICTRRRLQIMWVPLISFLRMLLFEFRIYYASLMFCEIPIA